ncbi:hypothetical protein ACFYY1_38180 [Streptomyces sp. NPDC001890]|uniref:hypothetical protein n=1 Tax=Streptomyces sp. NPDC001890 TaxID=3364620 RepID=UPI0036C02456
MTSTVTTRSLRLGTRPSPMAMEQTGRFAALFRDRYPKTGLDVVTMPSTTRRPRR